jgi:hypothetical protein
MMMDLLIWISFLGSAIATLAAVIVQYRDLTPDGTSTMGGQMLSGALWSLVTAFCSIGILTVAPWYWVPPVIIVVYALSLGVRVGVGWTMRRELFPTFCVWRNGFVWRWATFNTVAILAALFLMAHLTAMLQLPVFSSFMLSSVLIALAQGKAVQHSLGTGWSWCAVTILGLAVGVQSGFFLGWIVVMSLNLPQWESLWLSIGLMGLLSGVWIGGVTGTAQLLVLSRYAVRSWRWILLSAGGWGVGSMVGFALARLLPPLGTYWRMKTMDFCNRRLWYFPCYLA